MARAGRPRQFEIVETADELYQHYRKASTLTLRWRYQALWLLKSGTSLKETARQIGRPCSTVQNVIGIYRAEGLAGMKGHQRGGRRPRKSKLSEQQAEKLEEECRSGRFRHSGEIAAWLWLTDQIALSASGLRQCLYRLGLSWKTMRPVHPRRSEDLARWWKEFLFKRRIEVFGSQIIFFDELRLGLIGQMRRAWGKKGLRLPQPRQRNYKWAYLALGLDPSTHTISWEWIPNMKAATLLELMGKWTPYRAVVWDRAPSHRAGLLDELPIGRIELPPYSPDLNPVERIFEEIRRQVEGVVYETIEDKKEAVEAFLRTLTQDQIKSLTNWDYIKNALQVA